MLAERIEHALDEIRAAIYEDGYKEFAKHQSQLMRAESELMEMLVDIQEERMMTNRHGLAHMVVDSWPLSHRVSEAVVAAVQAYEDRRKNVG